MKFGIVEHPGSRANIVDDESLFAYVQRMHSFAALAGFQPITPGWDGVFSPKAISKLDYVIMDALELPDGKGNVERIWQQRFILYNKSTFMDRYTDYYIDVLENGKSNILANPTFLPISLAKVSTSSSSTWVALPFSTITLPEQITVSTWRASIP